MLDVEQLSQTVRRTLVAVWSWLTASAAPPPPALAVALLAAGAALTVVPATWSLTRPWGTWIHEAGHAVAATAAGARITGLRMASDGSGSLSYEGFAGTHTFISAAGYPAASVVALVCAAAVRSGYPRLAVAAMALVVFMLVAAARGFHSVVWTLVASLATAALVFLPAGAESLVLLVAASWAAFAGLRMSVEVLTGRTDPSSVAHSDADAIAAATGVPARIVSAGFVAFASAAVVAVIIVCLPG